MHFFGICLGLSTVHSADLIPQFTTPATSPYLATEGKAALIWQVPDNTNSFRYELQQSLRNDFAEPKIRYQGVDQATYISGLPTGDFFYRVRITPVNNDNEPGPWSKTLQVRVEYVSLHIVLWLTSIGLFVFVATVLTVITGHRHAIRAEAIKP